MLWRWSFGPAKRQYHSGRAFAQPCRCAHFQRRIPRRAAKSDGAHGAGHELEPGARACARPGAAAEARPAADPSAGAVGLLYTKNNSGRFSSGRRYFLSCGFVQSLKQAFSKADCAGNIGVFKLIIVLKHTFIPSDCFLYCGLQEIQQNT